VEDATARERTVGEGSFISARGVPDRVEEATVMERSDGGGRVVVPMRGRCGYEEFV